MRQCADALTRASIFVVSSEAVWALPPAVVAALLVGACAALLCILSAVTVACRGQSR